MPSHDATPPEPQSAVKPSSLEARQRSHADEAKTSAATLPALHTQRTAPAPQSAWSRQRLVLWVGVAFAALVLLALFYAQPWAEKAMVVATETVTPGPLTRLLAVNGSVAAQHSVDVRSTVSGPLQSIMAVEGGAVRQGDVLARIDPAGQQTVVRQALAGLDAGLVALAQAEANLQRDRALGANVARATLENAERGVQTAAQEVGRLTAIFDQAQIALGYYTIKAPISATIVASEADIGQTVDPASVLFTLADLGQLVVETDVDEAYATQITIGQPVVMQIVGEAATRSGQVSFVAAQIDQETGGLAVKLVFDQPVTAPVGLTVTANITVDSQSAAISVPRAAVVTVGAGNAVFVVLGDIAHRRDVDVLPWPAARLMVTQGLAAGDVVIVDAAGLVDGQSVTVAAAGAGD